MTPTYDQFNTRFMMTGVFTFLLMGMCLALVFSMQRMRDRRKREEREDMRFEMEMEKAKREDAPTSINIKTGPEPAGITETPGPAAALHVREFNGPLLLPSETGKMYFVQAKLLKDTTYKPDLFRTREVGWSMTKSDDVIPSSRLADEIVIRFLHLVEKRRTGKLEAPTF